MAKQKTSEPLTGAALLQKVKTLATLSKTQKAKACGYYTVTKGGGERVNLLQFLKPSLKRKALHWTNQPLSVVEMDAVPITGCGASEWSLVDRHRVYRANGAQAG
jgi:hypothetical protein